MKKEKLNIAKIFKRFAVNRSHKDRLFQRVFADKRDLLDLYNAVNHTDYANPDELEITTLEDVIYMSMKNDISFIISSSLNLYEHQSTFNPNMPVRGLMYFARLYEGYIKKHGFDIYGSRLVRLPRPQFIIFYNGRSEYPDEMILKLSDAFVPKMSDVPVLECRATMLNINYGHNNALLNSCRRLHDYSYFIAKVNECIDSQHTVECAISEAIDHCIEKDILADILIKCKSEVTNMLLTEFDEKLYKKTVYNEGYEDGVNEGFERGHESGISEGFESGISEGFKRGINEAREQDIKNSIEMLRNLDLPDERIADLISESYSIEKADILKRMRDLP